jgi:hypothetical protein
MSILKKALYTKCLELLDSRIAAAKKAMEDAQESANNEDKSSAGDKYETSRAMGQLDRDMYAKQLAQALNEKAALTKINIDLIYSKIAPGALVKTDKGNYFICMSGGQISLNDEKYMFVSAAAPIVAAMLGKQSKETFTFLSQFYTILYIE